MRLRSLDISNFRSCYATRVDFSEDLTLLVGENDAGKSNIIDALRAATLPTSARRSRYFDRDRDLSYDQEGHIEVRRTYSDLTAREDALFAPVLVDADRNLVHTAVYRTDERTPRRSRLAHLAGSLELPDPEPELRDRIAHVYLPPLRDVARALESGDGNRLADVVRAIASDDQIADFEREANESLKQMARHGTAKAAITGVQKHLSSVTRPVRHRHVTLEHRKQRMHRLVRALRLNMAAAGLTPTDLAGSGMGYANLLYIATVVLELERAREYELTLMLVEEPEAHLHPQLQGVLLDYLRDQARSSREVAERATPSGRIQVIATTHSPYLASGVSTAHVVVAVSQERAFPDKTAADEEGDQAGDGALLPPSHTETKTVSLAGLPLSNADRRKIDRYLDATRAALLFARQVVLVEGVAEALLLRVIAERVVFPPINDEADAANRAKREQFRAISVVPIGGVDFMPYLTLLLSGGSPLATRVVVVTDGDGGAGARRREAIEKRFTTAVAEKRLAVHVCSTTLEAELYGAESNEPLLREAFKSQHPHSLAKWDDVSPPAASSAQRAAKFSEALKQGSLDLGKGDFAQVVADLLEAEDTSSFVVPSYLQRAIKDAVLPVVEIPAGGDP
jgi:putative ATP-dependent endonuclease of OLD family